jgi:predicted DCC family thiol-disulfide oxidoreductase YuxK
MPEIATGPSSDPAAPGTDSRDLLFYDGTCGLCHRWVRLALRRDTDGTRFRFAPIGGRTWRATFPGTAGADLPDSIILRTADGRMLVKSEAVRHIAARMGAGWGQAASTAGLLPAWLLDAGYDLVARSRRHLFAPPPGLCPILPAELRSRFEE